MTQLKRWDTGAVIYEGEGAIAELVAATQKFGISKFRANLCGANLREADLRGADLRGANLRGANLCEANLCEADLCSANLREANLCGANLREADLCSANLREADLCGADLCGADLPIWCRWAVSYKLDPSASVVVSIGCKSMTVLDWDVWFAGSDVFDTLRNDERFLRIRANYLAMRAYLVALGHHKDPA